MKYFQLFTILIIFSFNIKTNGQTFTLLTNIETFNINYSNNKDISTYGYNKALNIYTINYNLGVSYVFKNNTEIKLTIGYFPVYGERNVEYATNYSFTDNYAYNKFISSKSSFLNTYLSYGKLAKLKNKIIDFSVVAPFKITYNRQNNNIDKTLTLDRTNILDAQVNNEYLPNYFIFGLFLNTGIYYKVFPKFFLGINVGTGIQYELIKGNYINKTTYNNFVQNTSSNTTQKINVNTSQYLMPIISNIGIRYFLK